MQELFYNRRLQVTLASILTGTRFKYFDTLIGGGSNRLQTQCRQCGECDSPAHLLKHLNIDGLPTDPAELAHFLIAIAQSADAINPHLSTPWVPEPSGELELEMDLSPREEHDEEHDEMDSLSFEGDIMEQVP